VKFLRVNQALGCVDDHKTHCRLGTMWRSCAKLLGRPSDLDQPQRAGVVGVLCGTSGGEAWTKPEITHQSKLEMDGASDEAWKVKRDNVTQ
jgi:hypothetical protein